MKKWALLVALMFGFYGVGLRAHTGLAGSAPGDGDQLDTSPAAISLSFTKPVRLFRFDLKGADGKAVNLEDYRRTEAATKFSIAVPELEAGEYTAEWIILGGDGHKMSGTFRFTLSGQ